MNLHLKTGLGNKNYVLDPNSDVENDFFDRFFVAILSKKHKNQFFFRISEN